MSARIHTVFASSLAVVGPSILAIINKSLLTVTVPKYLKHATVKPLVKKSNYRPISNVSFL